MTPKIANLDLQYCTPDSSRSGYALDDEKFNDDRISAP
jgi:hypothetical protein